MSAPEEPRNVSAELRQTIKQAQAKIAAENEAKREERNSLRWRKERTPEERKRQKVKQRADYAAKIAAEEGREVRAYTKVPGKTRAEHDKNAKARDAARKRAGRANADQATKDRENDRKWAGRKRKAGWTEEQIAQGLAEKANKRLYRQPEADPYENNPNFGLF